MTALQTGFEAGANPLDLLEEFVSANDWPFDRASDSELMVEIRGRWCHYHMCVLWEDELRAIFFSCRLDQKVLPVHRRAIHELLAAVNETLWLGHFELTTEDATPMFRHTIPLRGLSGASVEQLEDLVDTAVTECERFYPALQMIIWGGQSVGEALAAARMETVGEA
jgi:hypothetical protein